MTTPTPPPGAVQAWTAYRAARQHPDALNMNAWAYKSGYRSPTHPMTVTLEDLTTICGSTACLAGWIEALAGNRIDEDGKVFDADGTYLGQEAVVAADRLGLNATAAIRLFVETSNDNLERTMVEIFGPRPTDTEA